MFKKLLRFLLAFSFSVPVISSVMSCKIETIEETQLSAEDWTDIDNELSKMNPYILNINKTFKKVFAKEGDLDKIFQTEIIPNLSNKWVNKYNDSEINKKIGLINKIDFWIVFFDEEKDDTSSGTNLKNNAEFISWISPLSKIDLVLINKNFFICFDKYKYYVEDGHGYVKAHKLNVEFVDNGD